jgi:hypothetical protein
MSFDRDERDSSDRSFGTGEGGGIPLVNAVTRGRDEGKRPGAVQRPAKSSGKGCPMRSAASAAFHRPPPPGAVAVRGSVRGRHPGSASCASETLACKFSEGVPEGFSGRHRSPSRRAHSSTTPTSTSGSTQACRSATTFPRRRRRTPIPAPAEVAARASYLDSGAHFEPDPVPDDVEVCDDGRP